MPLLMLSLLVLSTALSAGAAAPARLATVAGSGSKGFGGDGGPATEAQLSDPSGITRGPDGSLYICDTANHRIRKVTPDGRIATLAGTGEKGWSGDGGPATAAKLDEPYEVRLDPAGNVYWVERLSHCVRRLDAKTGVVSTVAGTGTAGFSGDGGPASKAELSDPHSIGFDKAGDLYICDVKNHRIRKVDIKTGTISTFAGTGEKAVPPDGAPIAGSPLSGPRALDFDAEGRLWLALREGNMVLELDLAKGTLSRVAGTGAKGFTGDGGPAKEAALNGPKGIAVAPDGRVYVADTENHAVRRIDPRKGTIELVAGTGERGDGAAAAGPPLEVPLARPHGVFVDVDGTLFIGDTESHRIRVLQ
jgi:streptogramin lyase